MIFFILHDILVQGRQKQSIKIVPSTINIIGAGRVGKTIGKLFVKEPVGTVLGVFSRSDENAKDAVAFIGQGTPFCTLKDLPEADITFITTPDDAIEQTCRILVASNCLKENSLVVHCSGSLSSSAIAAAKACNCAIASVHPMRSFADPNLSVAQYKGTYCAIEGEKKATEILKVLFDSIGSITYPINSDKKEIYHAAGVFASNYLIVIAKEALNCLDEAGVPSDVAFDLVISLMSGTLNNLKETKVPENALTGPIKRGDIKTIEKHLEAMPHNGLIKKLYSVAALSALKLTSLPKEKKDEVEKLLSR